MGMNCEIILRWSATSEQLASVGAALWRWATTGRNPGIYALLDSQPLADMIAGKHPRATETPGSNQRHGISLVLRDAVGQDRHDLIARLRRNMPVAGVEDILIDGSSWNRGK